MPLILYFDEFEICNPLGSHVGIYKLLCILQLLLYLQNMLVE